MKFGSLVCGMVVATCLLSGAPAQGAQYLVQASDGPSFTSPQEAIHMLESMILPTFDALQKLEKEHKILGGGLPVGDRAFTFILEAASNEEADQIIRDIPAWPLLKWKVTALQSVAVRAEKERAVVADLKKATGEKAK